MKLFWYEKLTVLLFVGATMIVNAFLQTLAGRSVIPDEWMLAVPLVIFMIGSVIAFMGIAAAAPKGFLSVKYEMMGFAFLGAVFILFGGAAFWQVLSKSVVLPSVASPTTILMLLALASFSMHKTRERRKLTFG